MVLKKKKNRLLKKWILSWKYSVRRKIEENSDIKQRVLISSKWKWCEMKNAQTMSSGGERPKDHM